MMKSGPQRVLIVGGADSVWDDVKVATSLGPFDSVIAINDVGAEWPHRFDWWATLHPEHLSRWRDRRADNGFDMRFKVCTHVLGDMVLPHLPAGCATSGSSGLFAVRLALALGASRIVLAGVPMLAAGAHFFNARPWDECDEFKAAWVHMLPELRERVRSVSGWTCELLGHPGTEWLNSASVTDASI